MLPSNRLENSEYYCITSIMELIWIDFSEAKSTNFMMMASSMLKLSIYLEFHNKGSFDEEPSKKKKSGNMACSKCQNRLLITNGN